MALKKGQPQHVTIRLVDGVSIRKQWLMPMIHEAIRTAQRDEFRIVEFNVLTNHLHLIVEAESAAALGSGMNWFEARVARGLNEKLRRTGPVFDGRYHVRALSTPTEVRNALRYVLLNARHHAADAGRTLARGWLDPYSSAPWFTGWSSAGQVEPHVVLPARPTVDATSWLLVTGWQRLGLLSPDEVPGVTPAFRSLRRAAPRPVQRARPPLVARSQLGLSL
jgi:REP element-mobilizing transposase RayT